TQLLTAPPAAISSLFIFNNQLYLATKEAGIPKIGTVGTGLPTTASQTITGLPGIPETAVPDQFVLFDSNPATPEPDVLYFTEGDLGNLQKYVFNGSAWESKGTVKVAGTTDEIRGLTGSMVDGNVVLYSTSETKLLKFTDQAAITSTLDATVNAPALLAEAAANTQFKGVAYTPGTNPNNPLAIGGMFYEQIGTLHIFPNPVQNQFALSLPEEATNQNLKVALITGSGQTLATFSGSLKTINQQLQTRVTGLKAGIFFLKVTGAKGAYSARFYKQ
ncbi:MAG: T9SS type A sorting domain-containing protein, partial [Rufibacter sp.]